MNPIEGEESELKHSRSVIYLREIGGTQIFCFH